MKVIEADEEMNNEIRILFEKCQLFKETLQYLVRVL